MMLLLLALSMSLAADWWLEPNEVWPFEVWNSSHVSMSCCKTTDGGVPLDLTLRQRQVFAKPGGFFVESGGQDGLLFSNTLAAEKRFGWRGLLIEPSKSHREPPSPCLHAALTKFGGPQEIGLSDDGSPMAKISGSGKIPAYPLSLVLDRHKIHEIDFWSLDVEGYELEALDGVNFTRHRPTWILIEVSAEGSRIFAKMEAEGYCLQPGINRRNDISGWAHQTAHRDYLWKDCTKT